MKQKLIMFAIILFSIAAIQSSFAQDIKESLFKESKARLTDAESESVNLMSPSFYGDALKSYNEAEKDFKEGASLNDIKEQLAEMNASLNKAFKTAEVGKVTFARVLEVRNDAVQVSSEKNVPVLWKKAEEKLREAGEELEDGDVNDARDAANIAEGYFKDAELESIKIAWLVETRKQIEKAEDQNIGKNAPVTLALSKQLVKQCEKELNENRYDTDLPRSLAKQAQYEINHAFFINRFVRNFEDKDQTLESLILSTEKEFMKIAAAIGNEPAFDNGFAPVADGIVEHAAALKTETVKQKETIAALEQEVKLLKDELSGLTSEKSELAGKMEKLNMIKEKYAAVEKIFSSDEAQILRKENDIIIRLVGLSFDVGQSVIKPEDFGLLTRLQKAIKEFPEGKISIEGHTDSFGSDASNLNLSQQRADAVTQYLLANMTIDRSRITSTGYGETVPIANNETNEGRAKNRRIDLRIKND